MRPKKKKYSNSNVQFDDIIVKSNIKIPLKNRRRYSIVTPIYQNKLYNNIKKGQYLISDRQIEFAKKLHFRKSYRKLKLIL